MLAVYTYREELQYTMLSMLRIELFDCFDTRQVV